MTLRTARSILAMLCATVWSLLGSSAPAHAESLEQSLHRAAPDLATSALGAAIDALSCANASGEMAQVQRLAVIDYSLPSTQPRLWVFDLEQRALLFHELVAHGRESGEKYTQQFSNREGSRQTSLGLFRTTDTYVGSNGYSLRLVGLDPGYNDQAMSRAIVMHGAPYVNEEHAARHGRIGRSWGCPAVRAGIARPLIDALKGGQLLFSYYPDRQWLRASRFLNCASARARRPDTTAAAIRGPGTAMQVARR